MKSSRRSIRPHRWSAFGILAVAVLGLGCREAESSSGAPEASPTPVQAGMRPVAPQFFARRPGEGAATTADPKSTNARTSTASAPAKSNSEVVGPKAPAAGPRFGRAEIKRSLEGSMVDMAGRDLGPSLAQVVKRVLVWWMDIRRDLRPGDVIEVVYEPQSAGQEPIAHAIWLTSSKLKKRKAAIRFKPQGARFARWYEASGREVERRLVNGPIEGYEQITSLLNDGRRHRGVDFKAPVGTPIKSPFNGVVVRKNWSRRRNGNCLELRDDKTKMTAFLLHLDRIPKHIRAGRRVSIGDVIADSGNTGRSTAPHLHYQLELGGRVKNPFRVHSTRRRKLSVDALSAAKAVWARYEQMRAGSM